MKKVTHKLSIQRETLVSLSSPGLAQAAGGSQIYDTVYRVPPKKPTIETPTIYA